MSVTLRNKLDMRVCEEFDINAGSNDLNRERADLQHCLLTSRRTIPSWQGVSVDDNLLHPAPTTARTSAETQSWCRWSENGRVVTDVKRKTLAYQRDKGGCE
jgi:hypothetical protein